MDNVTENLDMMSDAAADDASDALSLAENLNLDNSAEFMMFWTVPGWIRLKRFLTWLRKKRVRPI